MDENQPPTAVKMAALRAANRALLNLERREQRTRKVWEKALAERNAAARHLKLCIDALQPELPSTGTLPS